MNYFQHKTKFIYLKSKRTIFFLGGRQIEKKKSLFATWMYIVDLCESSLQNYFEICFGFCEILCILLTLAKLFVSNERAQQINSWIGKNEVEQYRQENEDREYEKSPATSKKMLYILASNSVWPYSVVKWAKSYCVFHQFRQAKFAYGHSILSSSQFCYCPSCLKNIACFKSGQRWLKNNRLATWDLNPRNSLYNS